MHPGARICRSLRGLAPLLMLGWLAGATPANGQTPVTFVAVALDEDTRRADDKLRRYLESAADVTFVSETASEYGTVIDRLVTWRADRGAFLARVTPYALVAAELLGANVQVLATYVSRATHGTTYSSYLVVNRARFPYEPSPANVWRYVRQSMSPPTFAYQSEFSTSSYFLPALYFRRNAIFDMPARSEHASAIRVRQMGNNSTDLVKAVAIGACDMAAVWSGTKVAFEQTDSLAARYGRKVYFIGLPTALPNDLLVASASLDSVSVARIRGAIGAMTPDQITEGDFLSWRDINTALDAREALANLRQVALEPPAAATVEVRRSAGGGSTVPELYLSAARRAIRLSGLELVNYDRDFHAQQDYLWTLEPMHDGAVLLRSTIVGSNIDPQEFRISFRDAEELTSRIGELLRSRLHRIRYLWPYRTDPPTVLRDVDFSLSPGTRVTMRKIRWLDPRQNAYLQDAQFDATVARSDFYKFELSPSFVDPPDNAGFTFNPMSNISYRVVLARGVHERPLFRVLTAALVVLLIVAGVASAVEFRRLIRTVPLA